uniref:Peptidase S54 rhomboid domain-containing protein n=1 Tax=Vitis vinifera TaxID=29760 RepID=A5BSH8_VITVI|nr:hypothetical protein VITISV_019858 [Vitis vinifera]
MQRLISLKVASDISRRVFTKPSSLLHSHPYKTFFSLSQPSPTHHLHTTSLIPPPHFPWPSHHGLSRSVYGFISNPTLLKQFLPTALLKGSSKTLAASRVGFLRAQFPRRSFGFSPSFDSYGRRWRSWLSGLSTNDVVLGLIIANVAVFMLWRISDHRFMLNNFTIGRVFGPEFLLKLYLAGAVVGSVFYLVHHAFMAPSSKGQQMWSINPSAIPGLGASGAVNAIMLLDIFLFPRSTLYLEFFIPVPAILLGIFLIGKDMLRIIEGDDQISGSAHLGGAAVAAIAWTRLRRRF